ncbi:MAG: 2'-5' RNA ligase family protein [Bacteroidetes bacterium]|nr:2'-5' RNA ligase family protein [Bacteroidota bacterium]MBS1974362.1 2'-5' RNA ligase family protein [Bacteroidota bacterium]
MALFAENAGYRQNEYLLILSPHEELRKKIQAIKNEFYEKYRSPNAKWGKPIVTLVKFTQLEMMEDRVVNRLKTVAMGFRPIKVELKDFGAYPSHTIYINVTTKEPIRNLVKEIKPWQKWLKLNDDNKPHFLDEPHLGISWKLKPWQYEEAWKEYAQKSFTGRFIADSMLLLKRQRSDMPYQIAGRFAFQDLPVCTKQGELFA